MEVEGRRLSLSNLDKVMYPEAGFTKGQLIDYYTRIAPVLLPHLRGHPLTLKRYPERRGGPVLLREAVPVAPPGVGPERGDPGEPEDDRLLPLRRPPDARLAGQPRRPRAAPVAVARGGDRAADRDGVRPRPRAAGRHRRVLRGGRAPARDARRASGLESFPKTSGSKGMQVYVPLNRGEAGYDDTKPLSQALARHLEAQHPKLIVSTPEEGAAPRQGADRLEPERRAQDHGVRLLAARRGAPRPCPRRCAGMSSTTRAR